MFWYICCGYSIVFIHHFFIFCLQVARLSWGTDLQANNNNNKKQQQQHQQPTTTTFEKVSRCFLNSIQGLEFKEIFQEHSECFIFCSIYFGCMCISFFLLSFCSLFAFSACFMLYFYFWLFLFLPWKIFWAFTPWLFLFYRTGIFHSTNDNNKCLILWFCIYSLQAAKPEICDVLWNRPDYILHFTFVQYTFDPLLK